MSDDAYNDDALNNDADYKAERFKAFREEMEKIGYSIAGEIDLCIGKGIRFRKTSDIGHKMTFADWVEAKRAKGEEINFIGHPPTVTVSFETIDDAPFLTEDDLLNPDDGHIIKDLNEIYASSLIRRKAKLLYLNTMLAQRPAPLFGFIDTKVCCDRVAPVITPSVAPAIDGKHAVTSSIAGPAAFDNKHAVKGSVDGPIVLSGGA
jgi:hypothetical protein